jgi:hypothetical protein
MLEPSCDFDIVSRRVRAFPIVIRASFSDLIEGLPVEKSRWRGAVSTVRGIADSGRIER